MLSRLTTNGGATSRYPCSRVWRSSMKAISPRESRAPIPVRSGNPDPEILAPRGRSRRPSRSPSSQCGLSPLSDRGVPHARTTRLAAASPSGTAASGRLGTNRPLGEHRLDAPQLVLEPGDLEPQVLALLDDVLRKLAVLLHEGGVFEGELVAVGLQEVELAVECAAPFIEAAQLVQERHDGGIAAARQSGAHLVRRGPQPLQVDHGS